MKEKFISLQEATKRLGVARGTLDYYLRHLEIQRRKFPLDKQVYISLADFARINQLRADAVERRSQTDPQLPRVEKPEAA